MIKLEDIREKLSDRNLRVVAERSGVNYGTVWRIANGINKNPSFWAVMKIHKYLTETESDKTA